MATKCGKNGCEKEATRKVRFIDVVYTHLDTEYPIVLCEGHAEKMLQEFERTDVTGVRKWLAKPLASL